MPPEPKHVLVVSAHPDDESLGCGGAIRAHALAGDIVDVLYLTSGESGGHGADPGETARTREAEARAAGDVLGVDRVDFWRQPDGALRAKHQLAERLRDLLDQRRCSLVYVTHPRDAHPDHQAAARLVMSAVSKAEGTVRVLFTEIWTPMQRFTELLDISEHMEVKLAAVRCHATQCAVMNFPEAVRSLNRYRGVLYSWPGGPYAEVFSEWKR